VTLYVVARSVKLDFGFGPQHCCFFEGLLQVEYPISFATQRFFYCLRTVYPTERNISLQRNPLKKQK